MYFGGPVETPGVMALLRDAASAPGAKPVFGDVQLVSTPALLAKTVSAGTGPDRFRVYVGYAGWAAGQLERETALGAWHVIDGDPDAVFDPEPDTLWRREAPRRGERTASTGAGGSPHTARDVNRTAAARRPAQASAAATGGSHR